MQDIERFTFSNSCFNNNILIKIPYTFIRIVMAEAMRKYGSKIAIRK